MSQQIPDTQDARNTINVIKQRLAGLTAAIETWAPSLNFTHDLWAARCLQLQAFAKMLEDFTVEIPHVCRIAAAQREAFVAAQANVKVS